MHPQAPFPVLGLGAFRRSRAALYMLSPDEQVAQLDAGVGPVGTGLRAGVTDSPRTAGRHRFRRNGPCRPLCAVLPAFWAGVGLLAREGGYKRSGGPWRASVAPDDHRALSRFAPEGCQHGWLGRGEPASSFRSPGDPVELPAAQEGIHSFPCVERLHVGRPDETRFFDQVDDLHASALSDLDLHLSLSCRSTLHPTPLPLR